MTGEASGGGVIWICGLSGVGKTTLAAEVARLMQETHPQVTPLDGDAFRKRYMPQAGYQREDRRVVAHAMSKAAWFSAQKGSLCVVSTISLFTEIHQTNCACERSLNLPFILSLLSAPAALLQARRGALMQDAVNVVGLDINAEMPDAPDHQFSNDADIVLLHLEAIKIGELWRARQAHLARPAS